MITDEQVERACTGYWPSHWPQSFAEADRTSIRGHMRAALTAALSHETQSVRDKPVEPEPVAPSVKALEWVKHPCADYYRAETPWGVYDVSAIKLPAQWKLAPWNGDPWTVGTADTLEAAKEAAQSDFAHRVSEVFAHPAPTREVIRAEAAEMHDLSFASMMKMQAQEARAEAFEEAAKIADAYAARMHATIQRQKGKDRPTFVAECKADAGESLATAIREAGR